MIVVGSFGQAKVNPVHQHTFATLSLALAGGGRNHGMLQSLCLGRKTSCNVQKCSLVFLDLSSQKFIDLDARSSVAHSGQATHLSPEPQGIWEGRCKISPGITYETAPIRIDCKT